MGAQAVAATVVEEKFKLISVGLISESKTNPRKTFDPQEIEELAGSIRTHGIVEPLVVRPVDDKEAPFELVAGERRLRAARKAGLEDVPCMVRKYSDQQALEVQVIENLQRKDLHPLEEAEGYRTLIKRASYDVKTIAEKVSKSVGYVYAKLKLADLVEPAKKAFLDGKIEDGHAVLIARLQPNDQKDALKASNVDTGFDSPVGPDYNRSVDADQVRTVSVKELGRWIQQFVHLDLSAAPWKKDDQDLVPRAGACSACPKRDVSGKKASCVDRACFKEKFQAWIQRHRDEVEKSGQEFVAVSDRGRGDLARMDLEKLVLPAGQWHVATPKCEGVRSGLVVHGAKMGQAQSVCVIESCAAYLKKSTEASQAKSRAHRADVNGATDKWRSKQLKMEKRRREIMQLRRRILDATLAGFKKLTPADLKLIAVEFFRDIWHERRKLVAERFNLGEGYDLGPKIEKLPDGVIPKFILACALTKHTHIDTYSEKPATISKPLDLAAKRHGVKWATVEKQFKAELDAKKKSPAERVKAMAKMTRETIEAEASKEIKKLSKGKRK